MAYRDKIQNRGAVVDKRGTRLVQGVGGVGIGGLLLVLAAGYFGGTDTAFQVLNALQGGEVVEEQRADAALYEGEDDYERFAATVVGSTNALWEQVFEYNNKVYQEPTLVLFRDLTTSGCGGAVSQAGPHYCPVDETIYLDETFFEELKEKFGGSDDDVAQAYVIAHEVGHHVQYLRGTTDLVAEARARGTQEGNDASIKLELQADCYAGVWMAAINEQGILEVNEIDEALEAAGAVGDDSIQKKVNGAVRPETWTHGSSAQRKLWFERGFQSGTPSMCDTFDS